MNNVPVVSLQTAVLNQVLEFAKSNTTFSLHDITRTLRDAVNTGVLEIPECEVPKNDDFTYNISHPTVKTIFFELRKNDMFYYSGIAVDIPQYNGTYYEYKATVTPTQVPVVPVVVDDPVVDTDATVIDTTEVDDVDVETDASVENRVLTYLYNCERNKVNPTLKQVQSAIKRRWDSKTVTVSELLDVVKSSGYSVKSSSCTSQDIVNTSY